LAFFIMAPSHRLHVRDLPMHALLALVAVLVHRE
jgi:hypothetical protein